jgi:hypothetical protein
LRPMNLGLVAASPETPSLTGLACRGAPTRRKRQSHDLRVILPLWNLGNSHDRKARSGA